MPPRAHAVAPRGVSFTSAPSALRNQAGQPADDLVAEAVGRIRAGLQRGGAHGALPLERVLRDSRVRSRSMVGAPPAPPHAP